ncbi:MAG TPA: 23S rRNA (adenine(2503)-C(2))-methyltransferase RlmN [Microbacteriaceae bacterium]|nr:23S rRNA (adenine(2503)-C(2))-methyltransferase RlmN [Microbacteriaceae bacterium]
MSTPEPPVGVDRPQVRPATEGWVQRTATDGRPLLQFEAPRRGKPPVHLGDLTPEERAERVMSLGLPRFRAKQLSTHWFAHYTDDPAEMTDLPKDGRAELVAQLLPPLLTSVRALRTDDGATVKFLWRLFDGALIESVLMRYPGRITLCISSQAGCGMNCPFCATGQAGLTRNLSTAEILAQIVAANRYIRDGKLSAEATSTALVPGSSLPPSAFDVEPVEEPVDPVADRGRAASEPKSERVNNIVFMGMGEPLANYNRVLKAIRSMLAPQPDGLGMSARGITVSSVGLAPAIRRLAGEGLPLTFALSLHAPDDELRDDLIPINDRWKVDEALDAARLYFETTGRRVSIEYALIKDMNDHAWRADLLAEKLNARGRGWVHVNPIPLNPTPGSIWTASDRAHTQEFLRRLNDAGIPATLRDTRGKEIDGACGQLAATEEERAEAAALAPTAP